MDFHQLVAHFPFEPAHPQLTWGRECHVSTSRCTKNHLVLLTLNLACLVAHCYGRQWADSPSLLFPSYPQSFCRPLSTLHYVTSFLAWRVLDFLVCPDQSQEGPSPHQPSSPCGSRDLFKPRLGQPCVAWAVSLAGSSRSRAAHERRGSGSQGDPSTDRALTDWVQSHHVWAGLADRVRQWIRSRVHPESQVRSRQSWGQKEDQKQMCLQHMFSKNQKLIKGF